MALPLASIALFSGVVLTAGAVTAGGISFTADTVARMAVVTPVKMQAPRVSYGVGLPVAKAEDLNIARSLPVVPSESQAYGEQVAEAMEPAPAGSHRPPGTFVLENGQWVRIDDGVKGWVRNREGVWQYAGLTEQ